MISAVRGKVHASSPGWAEIETSGSWIVRVQVPVSSFSRLQPGREVFLHTVLKIKDEDLVVYGFLDPREKSIFERLLQVTGIGGKIAMACISGFSADELAEAIEKKDAERIASVPGIGKKTAQRMILELTGKLAVEREAGDAGRQLREELISGLVNLGFSPKAVKEAVDRVQRENPETRQFEPLFRLLLKRFNP